MSRPAYPRPPIVEAIVEVQFAPALPRATLEYALVSTIGSKYPGARDRHDLVEVKARLAERSVSTSVERSHHATLLRSGDGLRTITCVDGAIAGHVLAPYPGWERFREMIADAVAAIRGASSELTITALSVRYIDRIHLPMQGDTTYADWLNIIPGRPDAMPKGLNAFNLVTQSVDASDGTVAALALVSGAREAEDIPIVVYDLTLQRRGEPLCTLDEEAWLPILEVLHERQRDIFEGSITDRLRETFK